LEAGEPFFALSKQKSLNRDAQTSARDLSIRAVESEGFTRRRPGEGNQPFLLATDEGSRQFFDTGILHL
jgi:hypothetical protein